MSNPLFITELLKELKADYLILLDDAVKFFNEWDALYGIYAKETSRIEEIEKQLSTIEAYKEEHGIYPQIKDQPDAESYIKELNQIRDRADMDLRDIKPKVIEGFQQRRTKLNRIAGTIANAVAKEKDANKFITTMILRAPLESDHTRCANNEKNKPIYMSALAARLLINLAEESKIDNEFITSRVPRLVPSKDNPKIQEPDPEMLKIFKQDVLVPVIQAILIHNIGSYSIDADRIFRGNRFRMLDEKTRKSLVKIIYDNTLNYLKYGLGEPTDDVALQTNDAALEQEKFELTESLLKNYTTAQHPFGNILRIPMIYSSFMLSTKPKHDFNIVFKAYDILSSGIEKEVIYQPFTEAFQKMVGRYPLGTGIFFISKETNLPERAVVIGLNPTEPSSAIVKQLTRRQLQFDDHTQVEVSRDYNLYYDAARKSSDFGPAYYQKQFPDSYFWNPAELWERDIDHVRFWRRDNNTKIN